MVSRTVERAIYEKYKGFCVICGEKTAFDKGEVDHIKPKAKGGTDKPKNLQWLCYRCNKLKGSTRTNEEVKELLGKEGKPPKYVIVDDRYGLGFGLGRIKVREEDTEIVTDILTGPKRVIKQKCRSGLKWTRAK